KNREIELEKIQEEVNKRDEVQIYDLHEVSYDSIPEMMEWRPDKTYEVIVETEDEIEEDNLERLNNLIGTINQETPNRVVHRRADKLRKRNVKSIDWEKISDKKLKLTVKAEAGTYIKELVSSDDGRTYPSVKEMLKTECEPENLIVKKIHSGKYDKP
ncbi:MAG: tRNA pseudouridine(54/55) synthase Pus10, partial [Candidatus Aenigmatarchaeota archaeon]